MLGAGLLESVYHNRKAS
ncbi:hypothetical protein [Chryseobacterium sp.]|nr:hypothetical protein [Chryseobacterium sp.]